MSILLTSFSKEELLDYDLTQDAIRTLPFKVIRKLAERGDLHYYFTYLDFDCRIQSMILPPTGLNGSIKAFVEP